MGGAKVALLAAGLILLLAGCGRPPAALSPSPTPSESPSPAAASPTPTTGPAASPTPTRHVPSPSARPTPPTPSVAPRPTPSPAPLAIGRLPFHVADAGYVYAPVSLPASGGRPPYTWSITGRGTLPPGIALAADGTVSGTPTTAGTYSFTVHVADTAGDAAGAGASIKVNPPLGATGTCSTPCLVEQLCIDVCGGFGTQSGGTPPYRYTPNGSLPLGTTLSGLSLAGQFTTVGRWSFSVTITDALGATTGLKANFSVFAHISLTPATGTGTPGFALTIAMPYSGGSGAPTARFLKGTLPPGTTIFVNIKLSQVDIRVPAQKLSGTYRAAIGLTDQSPCSASGNCSTSATVTINIG